MRLIATSLAALALTACVHAQTPGDKAVLDSIDARYDETAEMARQIWDWAEVGYQEEKSSGLLQSKLNEAGFTVEAGVAGIPTAFIASYGSG
ncbi:MAG: amidohydrolase, partial [Hyphomonas sp.]